MNYKFNATPDFAKELKTLSKKYKSLKKDIQNLKDEYLKNPFLGVSLGGGFRKVRLKITSKGNGESGGARVISHEVIFNIDSKDETKSILLVSIYDKSEIESKKISSFKNLVDEFRKQELQEQINNAENNN